MRAFFVILIILGASLSQAQYSFPSGIPTSDANRIVERFGHGFLGKAPPSLTHQEDKSRTQVNLAWNWVSTKEVSKLGNGNPDRVIQYQEFYFTQELPFQVEIGLHANLLLLNNSVNTYGGYARWTFANHPLGALAIRAHGSSVNYRNLMGVNMAGGMVETDFYVGSFILTAGLGQLRSTASIKATVFGIVGDEPAIRTGDTYVNHMFRATYVSGRWNLSAQSNQVRDTHHSLLLGYVF